MESEAANIIQQIESSDKLPSNAQIAALLKALRKSKIRRPDIITKFGPRIINYVDSREVWNVYEQIVLASLDTGDINLASNFIGKLQSKFPNSSRIRRLVAMKSEAVGDYQHATEIYAKLLTENAGNVLVLKRQAAVQRAMGKCSDAVATLHNIIRVWPMDMGTWMELAEIHLSKGDVASAAFCFEEILLMDPTSGPIHCRLADCYYSLTGTNPENILLARKHYTLSLDMQGAANNLRALYGLIKSCQRLSEASAESTFPISKANIATNTELLRWGKDQLVLLGANNQSKVSSVAASLA